MSEKPSRWRRSFRSKRTNQKKDNKSRDLEDKAKAEDDGAGSVAGLQPTGGAGTTCTSSTATASSSQPRSEQQQGVPHSKSKALAAMRRLFSKLGKGKQKGKEAKPDAAAEGYTAAHIADSMQNGGLQEIRPSEIRTRSRSRSRSQIPIATSSVRPPSPVRAAGGSTGVVRTAERGSPRGIHNRRNSSPDNQPITARSLTKWDSSPRLNATNDNRLVNQQWIDIDDDMDSKHTPEVQSRLYSDNAEVSRISRSQFMEEQTRLGSGPQGHVRRSSPSLNHNRSANADPRSYHNNTHQGQQPKPSPRKDTRAACVNIEQYRNEAAFNGCVVPATPTRGGHGTQQAPRVQTYNQVPISPRTPAAHIPRPSPVPSHNSAVPVYSDPGGSNPPSSTPTDLPAAFRTLLEAPLPARPWHPDPTRRGSPNPSTQQHRPAPQPSQPYQKLPTQTTPPSVIHYHVTIQNSDGLDVNVKPTHTVSSQSNDIVAKTVYTADGRQLKRLSWIEVSPVPLEGMENEAENSKLDRVEPAESSSCIEIGSMSLGIDGSKGNESSVRRDVEGEVYFSEEAERMFANQSEVIVAASVPPSKQPVLNQTTRGNSGLLEKSSENVRSDNKTDFPWHSKRTGSQSSLEDNNQTSSKNPRMKKSKTAETGKQTSAGQRNEARKSPKTSGQAIPRPTFKPGQRNTSNALGASANSLTSTEGTFEKSAGTQTVKKRDRRRRSRPGSQGGENLSPPEIEGLDSGVASVVRASDPPSMALNRAESAGVNTVKASTSGTCTMNMDKPQIGTTIIKPTTKKTTKCSTQVEPSHSPIPISPQTSVRSQQTDCSQVLCSECRNLRRSVSADPCAHRIPSDIVARRRADFEKLVVGGDDVTVDDDVTAMRVGPHTTFFKNAQCQTNTTDASDTGTTMKVEQEVSERRSRPVGRVAPNVRRSASVHSPITPRDRWEARARSGSLQRHWSLSSMDTDIQHYSPPFYYSSRSNSTSSAEWDTISIDTDILTLETDRTLFETERTLREVEISIQESRNASRVMRRAQRQLDDDVTMTSQRRSRGVSADREVSDRDARRRNLRLESEARVAEISARIQARSLAHSLATAQIIPAAYPVASHRRETACDKLTRIRENLIRVPGVLILGLRGGKIAVTMSPDRPHFEPIYRFMRENDVSMAEYECAVLAQRYRSPTVGGSTFIHQPITAPVLVR